MSLVETVYMQLGTYSNYIGYASHPLAEIPSKLTVIKKMTPKIRFSVLTSCQSGCSFCHLEGAKSQDEIGTLNPALAGWKERKHLPLAERIGNAVTTEDVSSIISFAQNIGAKNIHLTGGEPTLHPQICNFIQMMRDAALQVTMTTHGEIGERQMKQILSTGINSINFSLHALEPSEYVEMDLVAKLKGISSGYDGALAYANSRLNRKKRSIEICKEHEAENNSFTTKINSVVLHANQSTRILLWSKKKDIECRLQKNLNEKQKSDEILTNILKTLNAELTCIIQSNGDSTRSGLRFSYPEGNFEGASYSEGTFTVKEERIGDVYLDGLCNDCNLKGTDACRERFYGVRANKTGASLCMDMKNELSQISFSNSLAHPLIQNIKTHYEHAEIVQTFL